jgi:hypothetical protein
MPQVMTLFDLQQRGVSFSPAEAVAVAQLLIHEPTALPPHPPFGPPSPDNISIDFDGSVICRACASTPAVSEIAYLLETLLPRGTKAPGGLRYAIARATHDVDASLFDSVRMFSDTLARFEQGHRRQVTRGLVAGWNAPRVCPRRARCAARVEPLDAQTRRRLGRSADALPLRTDVERIVVCGRPAHRLHARRRGGRSMESGGSGSWRRVIEDTPRNSYTQIGHGLYLSCDRGPKTLAIRRDRRLADWRNVGTVGTQWE